MEKTSKKSKRSKSPARKRSKSPARKRSKRPENKRSKSRLKSRARKPSKANQDNGMMTKIWGPAGWVFLHSCAMGYPVKIDETNAKDKRRKQETKKFFNSVGHVLPCRYCRDSYNKFIKQSPIDDHLQSRARLTRWLYRIHNKVNHKLGVPKCDIPTYKEVYDRYESYRAKCKKTTDVERKERKEKGCVVPEDGIRKRCIIKIVRVK